MFENFEITALKEFVDLENPTNFTFPNLVAGSFQIVPQRKRSKAVDVFELTAPVGTYRLCMVKLDCLLYDGECDYNLVELHFSDAKGKTFVRACAYHSDNDILKSIVEVYLCIIEGDNNGQ